MAPEAVTFRWFDNDGRLWMVPLRYEPTNVAPCRGCKQLMVWAVTPAGKKAPLNRDGTSHFATCPDAGRFRRQGPPPFDGIETLG